MSAEAPTLRPAQGAGWRDWGPSVLVAAIVGWVLVTTPVVSNVGFYAGTGSGGSVSYETNVRWYTDPVFGIAFLLTITGVLVGRWWPGRGTLLTFAPFVLVLFASSAQPAFGWWLGVAAVSFLAAIDGVRRAILPFVVAALLAARFCATDTLYIAVPIGATNSGTRDYAWIGFASGMVVMFGFVASAAAAGASRRSRARRDSAVVLELHAHEVDTLAGERARLARDLHDVVAHHVSLVAVRAESAPFVHPSLNDEARAVLAAIAADAREALTELRQVLVVLQRTEHVNDRAPQPTACDVDELVASAVAAGQPVEVVGTWQDVGPGHGYVLYRAVQEGLTNVRRHAPGATTTLERRQSRGSVGFALTNPVGPTTARSEDEPGRGLIGMRERVESLGGTLRTETVDGTFLLEVALPVPA